MEDDQEDINNKTSDRAKEPLETVTSATLNLTEPEEHAPLPSLETLSIIPPIKIIPPSIISSTSSTSIYSQPDSLTNTTPSEEERESDDDDVLAFQPSPPPGYTTAVTVALVEQPEEKEKKVVQEKEERYIPPPPPKRRVPASKPKPETWGEWGGRHAHTAARHTISLTDAIGTQLNTLSSSVGGTEHWFPVTGDFPRELEKATRILEGFTVDGVGDGAKGEGRRRIPPEVVREAVGVCVYSCMRNGLPPFGGSNGSGIVVARLEDGSWSAPSSVSPNSSTLGAMIGIDVFDAVLIIRTKEALLSFSSRAKFALGSDFAMAAGPYSVGSSFDSSALSHLTHKEEEEEGGKEKKKKEKKIPVVSYVRSRGLYAGLHLSGQVFVERTEENGIFYCYPGVRAEEILEGKIKIPYYAKELYSPFHQALYNAETGSAQLHGIQKELGSSSSSSSSSPSASPRVDGDNGGWFARLKSPLPLAHLPRFSTPSPPPPLTATMTAKSKQETDDEAAESSRREMMRLLELYEGEGERLRLPPRPEEMADSEGEGEEGSVVPLVGKEEKKVESGSAKGWWLGGWGGGAKQEKAKASI
ncbi:hypothetical protein T439DRAFT_382299 [Meredithblackwellia eburnea MCA 4105]